MPMEFYKNPNKSLEIKITLIWTEIQIIWISIQIGVILISKALFVFL